MKQNEILENLDIVKVALSSKPYQPILTHYCFNEGEVMAYNGEILITKNFKFPFDIAIPGDYFYKFVSTLKGEIDFTLDDTQLTIFSGKGKKIQSKLSGLSVDEFPEVNLADKVHQATLAVTEELLKGIENGLLFISSDETRPELRGVWVTSSYVYASDSVVVSKFQFGKAIDIETPVFLPESLCRSILRLKDCLTEIAIFEDCIMATSPEVMLFVSKPEIEFLDFEGQFNTYKEGFVSTITVPEELKNTVERVLLLLENNIDKYCTIIFSKDCIRFEVSTPTGDLKEDIIVKGAELKDTVEIDAVSLGKGLSNCTEVGLAEGDTKILVMQSADNKVQILASLIEVD